MSNVVICDEYTGLYATIPEETIAERISCFRSLRKAKHHKTITLNDLLKMFGFSECLAGGEFVVDDLTGVQEVSYKYIDAIGGKRYYLDYCTRPFHNIDP